MIVEDINFKMRRAPQSGGCGLLCPILCPSEGFGCLELAREVLRVIKVVLCVLEDL